MARGDAGHPPKGPRCGVQKPRRPSGVELQLALIEYLLQDGNEHPTLHRMLKLLESGYLFSGWIYRAGPNGHEILMTKAN